MTKLAESLGIRTVNGVTQLLESGTEVPTLLIRKFSTAEDDQRAVALSFVAADDSGGFREIGSVNLDGIPMATSGMPIIELRIWIYESGSARILARAEDAPREVSAKLGPLRVC
jgi:molecular chaperone DnaK (HSP70)